MEERRSFKFAGTAWIWLEIESTAFLTLSTAPLMRSVTELEVTEVARVRKEVKPVVPVWRWPPLVGVANKLAVSPLACELGAKVTLLDLFAILFELASVAGCSSASSGSGKVVEYLGVLLVPVVVNFCD